MKLINLVHEIYYNQSEISATFFVDPKRPKGTHRKGTANIDSSGRKPMSKLPEVMPKLTHRKGTANIDSSGRKPCQNYLK